MDLIANIFVKILIGTALVFLAILVSMRIFQLSADTPSEPSDRPAYIFNTTHKTQTLRDRLQKYDASTPLNTRQLEAGLFQSAPLSPLPFLASMIDAAQQGDADAARRFAEHALKLSPRNAASRLQIAGVSALDGEYEAALDQLRILIALDRHRQDTYLDAMAAISTDPASWPHIEAQLEDLPRWGPNLLDRLADTITDKHLYSRLYSYFPDAQGRYVGGLSRRGDWDEAFVAYVSFLETTTLNELTVPFDNQFQGLDAPQPFNWALNQQFAELEAGGGLYVHFFGRGRPKIASQTLVLNPGQYALTLEISGETWRGGGGLRWQVDCSDSRENLASLDILELNTAGSVLDIQFAVPHGCPFQNLVLAGIAGEFPRTTRANIDRLSISPLAVSESR